MHTTIFMQLIKIQRKEHPMDSILNSVKKKLGIQEDYTHFDEDIIMDINSVFMILNQLGVGPDEPFTIEDEYDTWDDFIDDIRIEAVKSYMYMRVRLMFDPPTTGFLVESLNKQIAELEWRMNVQAETPHLYPADMSGIFVK